jgi:hypothetical protein
MGGGMDVEMLSGRHIRLYKDGVFIPIRKPVNLEYLKKLDERIKPEVIFYTQGRFQFPERVGSKNQKPSPYFLFQDQIIVDIDEWTPDDILRIADSNFVYLAFTGSGFHVCLKRPRFQDEEVLSPRLREEITAKNNAFLLERIANEYQLKVDILPEPRHLFKIPYNFTYGNRMVKVWTNGIPSKDELLKLYNGERVDWRKKRRKEEEEEEEEEDKEGSRYVLYFSNNVLGTKAYVLIAYVSKNRAEKMVRRYGLKASVYFENNVQDFLLDIGAVDRFRIMRILRKESRGSLKTFLKYKRLLGYMEGDVEVLNMEQTRGISRGHASLLRWKRINVFGDVGKKKVILGLGKIPEG